MYTVLYVQYTAEFVLFLKMHYAIVCSFRLNTLLQLVSVEYC